MSEPEPPPSAPTLINPEHMPPGCTVVRLTAATATGTQAALREVVGRVLFENADPPAECAAAPGCEHLVSVVRCPTTGLNLPGEPSPVAQLVWCAEHGEIAHDLVAATQQEREWGWAVPSQV